MVEDERPLDIVTEERRVEREVPILEPLIAEVIRDEEI